jgi:hypothetical protein
MNNDTYIAQWFSNASIATGISSIGGLAVGLIGKKDVFEYQGQIYFFAASFFAASVVFLIIGILFNRIGRLKDEAKQNAGTKPLPTPVNLPKSHYAGRAEGPHVLDTLLNATDNRVPEFRRGRQSLGEDVNLLVGGLDQRAVDIRVRII